MGVISSGLLVLALMFDVWLLLSGTASELGRRGEPSRETAVMVRTLWGFLMLVTNIVIVAGAVQMQRLRKRGFSRTACILALIPCLGPCFVLGIPLGIWGLIALNDPRVRDVFES